MNFQELMLTYGYPMLFLGVLLESEAFLLVGVYLAQRGYFSLPAVIGLAALSSFCITQLCFLLGYRYGPAFIRTRPRWQLRYQQIERMMNRYGTGLVVSFRALYGLRGAIPAAVGMAGFSSTRFMIYNALGAIVWALVVALLGNNLVQGCQQLYDRLQPTETMVFSVVLGLVGLVLVFQLLRRFRLKKRSVAMPVAGYPSDALDSPLSRSGSLDYKFALTKPSNEGVPHTDRATSKPTTTKLI